MPRVQLKCDSNLRCDWSIRLYTFFFLYRMEDGVLGNALEGIPEGEAEEEDGEKEEEDNPKVPSAANLDGKTSFQLLLVSRSLQVLFCCQKSSNILIFTGVLI